ncbi:hypothetical protein MTO96_004448 [Rhipicephalus appendiculatus]
MRYVHEREMRSHISSVAAAAAAAGVDDDDGGLLRASRALARRHLGPRWGDPEEMETGGAPHRGPEGVVRAPATAPGKHREMLLSPLRNLPRTGPPCERQKRNVE